MSRTHTTHTSDTGPGSRRPLPLPVRELLVLHPMPSRHRSAAIAAVCTGAPVLAGQALGHLVLGLVASTGSLAALYGGRGTPRQEAGAVGGAAAALAAGMATGSSLAGHTWLAVLGTALWAAAVTLVFALTRVRPPGIVMPVLVCSVGTGLPPGHTGQRVLAVAAVGCAATVLSWLVAKASPAVDPSGRGTGDGSRLLVAPRALPFSPLPWMAVRTGAAVGLAGAASLLCQVGRPYWAMAAAAAVLARGTHAVSASTRAVLRGTGTLVGCLLAGALAATRPKGIAIAVLLAALTFVIELVVARNYAVAMVFVTPLSVLLVTSATGASAAVTITADRLLETVLGCGAAAMAGQLVTGRWAVRHRREAVTEVLTATAGLIEDGPAPRREARLRDAAALLRLVSERTAGERRGVRVAASALEDVATAALGVAEQALGHTPALRADAAGTARALRHAARLVDPCEPAFADDSAPALAPPLTELGRALANWSARRPSAGAGVRAAAGRSAAAVEADEG
ncbi:FUSC family protein [Streptomyces sp. NPDC048192]|uniref:FUSC family protein n=1 Tax=Streptomyces sp. NPDC048192 TaxID=3365510 RepID=UPI00371F1F0F